MSQNEDNPVASSSGSHFPDPESLLAAPSSSLTAPLIQSFLESLPTASQIVTSTNLLCSGKVNDRNIIRYLIETGLKSGKDEIARLEEDLQVALEGKTKGDGWQGWASSEVKMQVDNILEADGNRKAIIDCLALLWQALERLDTYDTFAPPQSLLPSASSSQEGQKCDLEVESEEVDLDDPWAEVESEGSGTNAAPTYDDPWDTSSVNSKITAGSIDHERRSADNKEDSEPPIDISNFILRPLPISALALAASAHLAALHTVCQRHSSDLWQFRLSLLQALPGWMSPADPKLLAILPRANENGLEEPWPADTTVSSNQQLLDFIRPTFDISSNSEMSESLLPNPETNLLTENGLCEWYTSHVLSLDKLGQLDVQLAWVQHAASLGVPTLDALGEDLSLLSRLIYDANLTPSQMDQWSLSTWREASERTIIRAYIQNSTADSIVADIRRLVYPYLYVLESRAERVGRADPDLVQRQLHDLILDLPLYLALPCFEASKALERGADRLIKTDMAVVRLALACLYGSQQRDAWATMSAIFECLPAWDVSDGDFDSEEEATATTLESIATFVRPTVSNFTPPNAHDLFIFFSPLPIASLSRAVDILDVHLSSGETLAQWDVPVYLRTLLQSANDREEQVNLAENMVRRQSVREMSEQRWIELWESMRNLVGGNDSLFRGAFGTLTPTELMRIFIGGLLSSGDFSIAKNVLRRLKPEGFFSPQDLEDVVLMTSREFYERAETSNIHTGDMKLAYECLSVAHDSSPISAERDLIQATSRLTTFRALSSLTPAEIRHTPNRLDLIRRVLSTSDDAFKHTHIILDLADKLGYRDNATARAEVLAMLCDSAIYAKEWGIARERIDEMIAMTEPSRGTHANDEALRSVVWISCLSLGKNEEYRDLVARRELLGHAVVLCPTNQIKAVLALWRATEDAINADPEAARGDTHFRGRPLPLPLSATASNEDRMLGSRTAARAARMALELGASFNLRPLSGSPASGSARSQSRDRSDNRELAVEGSEDEGVRAGAKRALVKGVGWLLGAEEGEIAG